MTPPRSRSVPPHPAAGGPLRVGNKLPIGQAWVDRGVITERANDPANYEPCAVCGTLTCVGPVHTVERIWTEEDMDREAEANRLVVVTDEFWEEFFATPQTRTPSRRLKFAKGQVITRREAEAHQGLRWTEQESPGVRGGLETK